MAIQERDFQSYNGRDTIKAWVYTPIRKPRGIVQVIHGFGEHSRRYLHMILKFNEAGFVVCADDHVGHGKTACDANTWGDYGDKGYMTTTEDEHTLAELVKKDFPGLPLFVFGHSWGSMIARNYAACYGEGISGLVICGTCGVMRTALQMDDELAGLVTEGKGGQVKAQYLSALFAGMTDRFENVKTPNDWISGDPDIVADHASDPFNNFRQVPNIQAMYDLTHLIKVITGPTWAEKVPSTIPVYNIAGDQDPVGQYGEGVYAVSNWLAETGKKVKTKLYSGHRHEIHNDRDIRDKVVDGIIDFLDSISGDLSP